MSRLLRIIPPSLLGALVLAACGGGSHRPTVPSVRGAGSSLSAASGAPGSLAAWRAAVACARRHGMPTLPDPAMGSNGQVTLPGLAQIPAPTPAVQSACSAQLRAVQAGGAVDGIESASDLHALLRVAACMRRHGFPNWPDPNNRGEFHLTSAASGPRGKMASAVRACNSLFPPSGWHLIVTPSGR